jgi:hypothetical protein
VSIVLPVLVLKLVLVSLDWDNQLDNALLLKRRFHILVRRILVRIRTLQSIVSVAGLP